MKKFEVRYSAITTSRAGSYIYNSKNTVEAETEEEAKSYIRKNGASLFGFKKARIVIKSIKEI